MAQEFTIKSADIESKINQLLPSQGGAGAGVDFSASTMVIPVVDLTETAEGSSLRQDLQSALSFKSATSFQLLTGPQTITLVNTTGYYRVFGNIQVLNDNTASRSLIININDGTTTKLIYQVFSENNSGLNVATSTPVDFIVKLEAGDSLEATNQDNFVSFTGSTRQIADLQGNLTNP